MWKVEVYRDRGTNWRWRLRAANGAIVGGSQESFDSRSNAVRAATAVRENTGGASLVVAPDPSDILTRALVRVAQRDASQKAALANLFRSNS
jgi:uncharacterized protein YegP (UPF0339 family)